METEPADQHVCSDDTSADDDKGTPSHGHATVDLASVSVNADNLPTSFTSAESSSTVIDSNASNPSMCTQVPADLPAADNSNCRSDFDEFLDFPFPDDDEFGSAGDIEDPFYFESDHVALKGNEDYSRLLQVFVRLVSQRTAALRDLDKLLQLQQKALGDPLQFVNDLRHGRTTKDEIPRPQKIVELPKIAWEQYTDDVESVLNSFGGSHHETRRKRKRELMSDIRHCIEQVPIVKTEPSTADAEVLRSASFNQPWSAEEQLKLEKLLKKYPHEQFRFESRRWDKIASELPGRTKQQVASRVQKYFIKLAQRGFPIPGKPPTVAAYGSRLSMKALHRHQRYKQFLQPSSTFMASFEPPVYMSDSDNDDENGEAGYPSIADTGAEDSDDDDLLAPCLRDTPEYLELQTLIALRRHRKLDDSDASGSSAAAAFHLKCEPRDDEFQSSDCPPRSSYVDPDYASVSTGIRNYLDPNYAPAMQ